MKKTIVFLLTFFLLALSAPLVNAQRQTEKWACLQTPEKHSTNEKGEPVVTGLSCGEPGATCSGQGVPGHRVRLTTRPEPEHWFVPNNDTYIVVCVGTGTEQICTTGNQAADDYVYGTWLDGATAPVPNSATNLADLKNAVGYEFTGLYRTDGITEIKPPSPTRWDDGRITEEEALEWEDYTPDGHLRKWLAVNYYDPAEFASGAEGGQQQGTFPFDAAERMCVSIAWDPYGRVFDAMTLEPILGAQVTLQFNKNGVFTIMRPSDLMGGSIINPQTTLEDGSFSFVVPDGDYKLLSVPNPIMTIADVHPNYIKAYSDLYPVLTGDVITQKGEIQHRDIPAATRNTNRLPKMMSYFSMSTSYGIYLLEGIVSHPLTKLNILTSKMSATDPKSQIAYRTINVSQANKFGRFDIEFDQNPLEKTADYIEIVTGLQLEKVDLRNPDVATGQTTTVKLEPIPQYLEGYAYDSTGKVMPNATVGVYLTYSKRPTVQVKTDANGLFKITSEYLPSYPYEIQYTSATGAKVKTTPSLFLAQNQGYLAENNISPFVGRDEKNNIAPTGPAAARAAANTELSDTNKSRMNEAQKQEAAQALQTQKTIYVVILVAVILLLVGVGVWLVLHFKKAHSSSQMM